MNRVYCTEISVGIFLFRCRPVGAVWSSFCKRAVQIPHFPHQPSRPVSSLHFSICIFQYALVLQQK